MCDEINWRGLTLQWDPESSRWVCDRWSLGQVRGKWRACWTGPSIWVAGESSSESPAIALNNLCLELVDTLKRRREHRAEIEAFVRVLREKDDLMTRDLESLHAS